MTRQYELLHGSELTTAIAREPIAWVPLGILEPHGEHLPYGLDGLKAHGVCLRLADALGGVVLPAVHVAGIHGLWHPDPEEDRRRRRQVGAFYVREETLRLLAEDIVQGLVDIGFQTIVLYSGHYPHPQVRLLRDLADQRTAAGPARVIAFHEPDATLGQGDHAGKSETSLYQALGGEARLHAIRPEHAGRVGFFSKNRPSPLEASPAYGEEIIRQTIDWFRNVLAHSDRPAGEFRHDLK